jgi:hypothetical protein
MRSRWSIPIGLVGAWLLAIGGAAAAELPGLIATNDTEFAIPFEADTGGTPESRPVLVQLMVSDDLGATWTLYDSISPHRGAFEFRAPHAGEFWFAIRTFNQQGRIEPADPLGPEMRVDVKTVPLAQLAGELHSLAVPPGIRPRMVKSCSFELDYDISQLEGAGVAKVELWWTHNGGAAWSRFGEDADRQSPMTVTVQHEGLYGFWMVIERNDGVRGEAPHAGSPPQIWVGVDKTPPLGRLTTANWAAIEGRASLVVHWEASDARLAAMPIALAMAASPEGPWNVVAQDIENSGTYPVPLGATPPDHYYIRLTVRDEAGNEQVCTSSEPIIVDRGALSAATRTDGVVQAASWFHVFR